MDSFSSPIYIYSIHNQGFGQAYEIHRTAIDSAQSWLVNHPRPPKLPARNKNFIYCKFKGLFSPTIPSMLSIIQKSSTAPTVMKTFLQNGIFSASTGANKNPP